MNNLLTYQKPNYATIGDACKHGLRAFHSESGIAWRYNIPSTSNLLEFLPQVVSILPDFLEEKIK